MPTNLPENRIKKIKLPNNTEYTIVPEILQNSGYQVSLPTLTEDSTIALTSDLDSRVSTSFLKAPDYSSSSTYYTSQRVVHDGRLYVCTTAIQTAEEWNEEHWTEITIEDYFPFADDITDLTVNELAQHYREKFSFEHNTKLYFCKISRRVISSTRYVTVTISTAEGYYAVSGRGVDADALLNTYISDVMIADNFHTYATLEDNQLFLGSNTFNKLQVDIQNSDDYAVFLVDTSDSELKNDTFLQVDDENTGSRSHWKTETLTDSREYIFPNKSGTIAMVEDISQPMTSITYDELKALRDNNELIPGMQYRITDYSCTTTQFDTRSAGHNFDIIVTADSTHILNENARACVNANDTTYFKKASGADWINPRPTPVFSYWINTNEDTGYGKVPPAEQGPVHGTAQVITEYTKINYNGRELPAMFNPDPETTTFTNSVVSVQYVVRDDEHSYEGSTEYKPNDVFCELNYVEVDNTTYPVLYKNDIRHFGYNNVDHDDVFRYDGDYTLDGTVYSRWKKYDHGSLDSAYYTGIDVLTQRIVVNNEFTITQEQLTAGIAVSHESSENDLYYVYDGTETIMEGVENTLCHALYAVNEDGEEVYADGSYKVEDTFVEISYMTLDGVLTPVMYKNDLWNKEYVEEGTDYGDVFVYIGNLTVDGTTYNRWRKYEHGNIDPSDYTGFDVLTEVIVVNNQFTISQQEFTDAIQYNYATYDKWKCLYASDLSPENGWYLTNKLVDNVYTESNLNTWELKYSLDNDTKRFGWALDGQQIVYNDVIYDRSSDNDNTNDNPDFTGYQIGWKSNDSSHNILYSPNETISSSDGLFNPVEEAVIFQPDYSVHTGKGVIYYMKDENNNECSYDFKNILFKRYQIESSNSFNSSYSGINSSQFPSDVGNLSNYSLYAYTFTWLTENNENIIDASVAYNDLPNDENNIDGVHNNIIKSYYDSYDGVFKLNNIAFISRYSFEDGSFYGINNNSFEPNCHDCSFLDNCYDNVFKCTLSSIFFSYSCNYNTIGNLSRRIVLNNDNSDNYLTGVDITIGSMSNHNNFSGGNIKCGDMFSRVTITNGSNINFTYNGNPLKCVEDVIIDSGCNYLQITSDTAYEVQYLPVAKMHIHTGVHGTNPSLPKIISKGRSSGALQQEYLYNYYANGTKDIILD